MDYINGLQINNKYQRTKLRYYPKEALDAICSFGYLPNNDVEANKMFKKYFKLDNEEYLNQSIIIAKSKFTNDKHIKGNVVLTRNNFFDALYSPIYNKLEIADIYKLTQWTFEYYSQKMNINPTLNFLDYNLISGDSLGCSYKEFESVAINVDNLATIPYPNIISILVHELTHNSQSKKCKLKLFNDKNLDLLELATIFNAGVVFENDFHDDLRIPIAFQFDKKYEKQFYENRNSEDFEKFSFQTYCNYATEIDARIAELNELEYLKAEFGKKFGTDNCENSSFDKAIKIVNIALKAENKNKIMYENMELITKISMLASLQNSIIESDEFDVEQKFVAGKVYSKCVNEILGIYFDNKKPDINEKLFESLPKMARWKNNYDYEKAEMQIIKTKCTDEELVEGL